MRTAHTPGPLTAQASGVYSKTGIKLADTLPRERMLATGRDPTKQYGAIGASLADAKLYAAAPDLLAACDRLGRAARHRDITQGDPLRLIEVRAELAEAAKQAREAIAKAKQA